MWLTSINMLRIHSSPKKKLGLRFIVVVDDEVYIHLTLAQTNVVLWIQI